MGAREFGSECIFRSHLGTRQGIPILQFWAPGDKKAVQVAPRIVYRLFVGEVQHWQAVSHRCGNRACLNPSHLYLRHVSEAHADQGTHGRLTPEDFWYIRRSPLSHGQLSARLGYSKGGIGEIRQGKFGRSERFSLRYALIVALERLTRKGRRDRPGMSRRQ